MWLDQPQPIAPSNGFPGLGNVPLGIPSMRSDTLGSDTDEDLIPTAIVIKNIPFAVKKEQLVQVMTDLCLPLPYAFNYHFDNGVFRGLAFANFTTPEETAAVIHAMNHLDLHGRKLRVEYKKMLPQAERDRIEREKRERRGQLEEQHRPIAATQLHNQPSLSSMSSHIPATSPSPNSSRAANTSERFGTSLPTSKLMRIGLDMNDPVTLSYYSKLILFQSDANQDLLTFPATLPPTHRKLVHGLAHQLGLGHASHGNGEQRQLHIFRGGSGSHGLSPTLGDTPNPMEAHRRQLNRAATTDFNNVKSTEPGFYGSPGTQSSTFLGFPESQGGGLSVGSNLRAAKSFHDLRSYTPSPSHSATNFPANLANNIARFTEYSQNNQGPARANVPLPTSSGPPTTESMLVNGLNNMNISNNGFGAPSTSPQRLRGMMSWDREVPGPIGGHRTYATNNLDDQSRNRSQGAPMRQPRGPLAERGNGFRGRQNGHSSRGSDEITPPNGVEILVE